MKHVGQESDPPELSSPRDLDEALLNESNWSTEPLDGRSAAYVGKTANFGFQIDCFSEDSSVPFAWRSFLHLETRLLV
jgi:hypothetical protein